MSFSTQSSTHRTITEVSTEGLKADVPSIRQICMTGILNGVPTKEIAAQIQKFHPTSAAAAKSGKHIAWYRATMKKAGQI